jgi:hypothetical protein
LQGIDSFFTQIQDGAWHSLKTLSGNSEPQRKRLEKLAQLLAKPDIVEYLPRKGQIRMKKKWQRLLKNTNEAKRDGKAAVGTIVLLPQGTIRVQGVQMTNLLGTEIEINIKVNKTLEEIALSLVERD